MSNDSEVSGTTTPARHYDKEPPLLELPTGTITFLFTDIEGSTKRWERNPEAMSLAIARHDQLLREAIESNEGRVFKTVGDAFCAAFATAPAAIAAALAGQRVLHETDWSAVDGIRVRMAIHTGAAEEREGDYFGSPLNRASRFVNAGHGGQTLISQASYELIRDVLPRGVALRDLGEYRLRDLPRPERIYQLVADGLMSEFPRLRTLDSHPNNLPTLPTSLIGREADLAAVIEMLRRPNVRLVTLQGPGGMGKTRLSLEVGTDLLPEFVDGVFFVQVASIFDPALLAPTIGQTLGLRDEGAKSALDSVCEFLQSKRVLLIVDNFEQVVEGATVIGKLLERCTLLKILVSSRIRLELLQERAYEIHPLPVPVAHTRNTIEQLNQYPAIRLFAERAQSAREDFALTNENSAAVVEICTRLDGLPLAIELAAARSRALSPEAMLRRMEKRLPMLTGGARDRPERHQTLRNTIAWSYDILEPADQLLFRHLAVFTGGFNLEAAEAIVANLASAMDSAGDADFLDIDVLMGVESLIDKSLLRRDDRNAADLRITMYETIREYGIEQLVRLKELDKVRRLHASYFLDLAEKAEPELRGSKQATWLARLQSDHENLRSVLDWAVAEQDVEIGLRLGAALWRYWSVRGHHNEGGRYLAAILELPAGSESIELRARVLTGAGNLARSLADYPNATSYHEQALEIWKSLGNKQGVAQSLTALALVADVRGDWESAMALYKESLVLKRELGDKRGIATTLGNLGAMCFDQEDFPMARVYAEESLTLFRQTGDRRNQASALNIVGELYFEQGDFATARRHYVESAKVRQELGDRLGLVELIEDFSMLYATQNQPGRAVQLAGAAGSLRQTLGIPVHAAGGQRLERKLEPTHQELTPDDWQRIWAEGEAMTLDEAVSYALREEETAVTA